MKITLAVLCAPTWALHGFEIELPYFALKAVHPNGVPFKKAETLFQPKSGDWVLSIDEREPEAELPNDIEYVTVPFDETDEGRSRLVQSLREMELLNKVIYKTVKDDYQRKLPADEKTQIDEGRIAQRKRFPDFYGRVTKGTWHYAHSVTTPLTEMPKILRMTQLSMAEASETLSDIPDGTWSQGQLELAIEPYPYYEISGVQWTIGIRPDRLFVLMKLMSQQKGRIFTSLRAIVHRIEKIAGMPAEAKSFIALIALYIDAGSRQPGEQRFVKSDRLWPFEKLITNSAWFLARTDFATMYQSLKPISQEFIHKIGIFKLVAGVLNVPERKIIKTHLFKTEVKNPEVPWGMHRGPRIGDWLNGILTGKDILKYESMGAMPRTEKVGINKEYMGWIVELRALPIESLLLKFNIAAFMKKKNQREFMEFGGLVSLHDLLVKLNNTPEEELDQLSLVMQPEE